MYSKYSTLFFLCTAIISCTYSPSDTNYHQISSDHRITPIFNIIDFKGDTLDATPGGVFKYDFTTDSIEIKKVQIYLSGDLLLESSSKSGTFWIYGSNLETGIYDLDMSITSSTGTQSLADQKGAETYVTEKHWFVAVDNDPPTPVQITNTQFDSQTGGLQVHWQRYNRFNFYQYYLESSNSGFYYINDQDSTSLILEDYYGLETDLFIEVLVQDNELEARSDTVKLPNTAPKLLNIKQNENNSTVITWSKLLYPYNFESYELQYFNGGNYHAFVTDLNDTSYVFENAPSSTENSFKLFINSSNGVNTKVYDGKFHYSGTKLNAPSINERILDVHHKNGVYFLKTQLKNKPDTFLKYLDAETNQTLNSHEIISGNILKFSKDFMVEYANFGSGIELYSYSNNYTSDVIDFGYGEFQINVKANTDHSFVYVELSTGDQPSDTVYKKFYYDLNLRSEILNSSIPIPSYTLKGNKIVEGNSSVLKYEIDSTYSNHAIYFANNSSRIAVTSYIPVDGVNNNPDYKSKLLVLSIPDFNIISETNFDGKHQLLHYNAELTKFLLYHYGYLLLLDDSGNELNKIFVQPGLYFFKNGKVVNEFGYMINIEM